jgi:phage-related protein
MFQHFLFPFLHLLRSSFSFGQLLRNIFEFFVALILPVITDGISHAMYIALQKLDSFAALFHLLLVLAIFQFHLDVLLAVLAEFVDC